mgnify:CR=1 FL=1
MSSAARSIRRLVEQQLVGGAWMGISHALYETPEPYYPDPRHGPRDFNEYLMPGPGDICPHDIAVLERPAPDGPFGAQGPGRDVRQSGAACGRQRDLQRGRRAHRRTADHARKGAARHARRAARQPQREALRNSMAVRAQPSSASTAPQALERALRTPRIIWPTKASRRPPIWRLRSASRCCSKARRASARPKPPRRSPRVLGRRADPAAMLRGHRRLDRAL